MKSLLRSWRIWWLALAVVAGPQLSLVHALSHLEQFTHARAGTSANASADERQQAADKVCDTCLSLAQLAPALGSAHSAAFAAPVHAVPVVQAAAGIAQRAPAHFLARAPPLSC